MQGISNEYIIIASVSIHLLTVVRRIRFTNDIPQLILAAFFISKLCLAVLFLVVLSDVSISKAFLVVASYL